MGGPAHTASRVEHVSEPPVQVLHGGAIDRLGAQALVDQSRERGVQPLAQPSRRHGGPLELVVPRVPSTERRDSGGRRVQRPAEPQASVAADTVPPWACSGAMYSRVPNPAPTCPEVGRC